jgi:hypothetical protein
MKHIDIKHHAQKGDIAFKYNDTSLQLDDIFSKPCQYLFLKHRIQSQKFL